MVKNAIKSNKRACILCSSDIFALEIMTDLRNEGFIPPGHYGLMGFDNISLLKYVSPRLTTICRIPLERLR